MKITSYFCLMAWIAFLQAALNAAYWLHLQEIKNSAYMLFKDSIPDYNSAVIEVMGITTVTTVVLIIMFLKKIKQLKVNR